MRKGFVLAALLLIVTGFAVAADGNGIENPRDVEPGDSITIPVEKIPGDAKEKPQRGKVVVLIDTENGKDVYIFQEKKLVGGGQHDEFDTEDKMQDKIHDYDGDNTPIIKGSALHDWIEDVRAGKADSARKEIAVKIQDEEGSAAVSKDVLQEKLDQQLSNRKSREGRNPQTGKEIKIPARDGDYDGGLNGLFTALAMEGKVKFFDEGKGYASIKEKESGEEYFVHATHLIDEIRDEDDVPFEMREGRKGMNAVDVRRTD